jgi:hypothetical protein
MPFLNGHKKRAGCRSWTTRSIFLLSGSFTKVHDTKAHGKRVHGIAGNGTQVHDKPVRGKRAHGMTAHDS